MITHETRRESFEKTDRATRRSIILAALGNEELMQSGKVEASGKKWDSDTERNVTVFRRKNDV